MRHCYYRVDAMRSWLVMFALALSPVAGAQQQVSSPRVPPPAPAVTPPVLLPFPPLMTPPAGGLTTGFPFTPPDLANPPRDLYRLPPGQPFHSRPHVPVVGGFVGGYFGPYIGAAESAAATARQPSPPPDGMLRLSVTPPAAHVYVDSYYVGSVADVEGHGPLMLPAGAHRIEIRAPEYEPVVFDVQIVPNEAVTYRAALEHTRPAPPMRVAPATGPTRMYVIPNCYLGNLAPRADRLPSGCDIKQVRILGAS